VNKKGGWLSCLPFLFFVDIGALMDTHYKRFLIAVGVSLAITVAFISPCTTQTPTVSTPSVAEHHTDCNDGSCPLPAGLAVPATKLVVQENWEFTLPGADWIEREPPAPDIKVAIIGSVPEHAVLVLFIKEEIDRTFTDYVIGTVRSFAEMEFKINSIKQVVINDRKFVLVQATNQDKVIWSWLSVKDKFGYAFSCGAEINVDAGTLQSNLCNSIAQTVKIQ
jgi:hypothetical protein